MTEIVTPGVAGGVFDYASVFSAAMGPDAARLVPLTRASAAKWRPAECDTLFLQYSGYGYATRGAPFWLLRTIQRRRHRFGATGVYFHELHASGPPWTSAFWLSPAQRYICRNLARQADFWLTNRRASAEWLIAAAGHKPHAVLPVFSTVGETTLGNEAKVAKAVVFGSRGLRQATYRAAGDELFRWARELSLELHDIGSPLTDSETLASFRMHRVVQHGHLERWAVGRLLAEAVFGIVCYPTAFVAKSSVLAAFCAHAVCPIILSRRHDAADGLIAGVNYLPGFPEDVHTPGARGIGERAHAWYDTHSIAVHVGTLGDMAAL